MRTQLFLILLFLSLSLSAQEESILQAVQPEFDTITVTFKYYEPPYLHRSVALDTSREGYQAYMTGNLLSFGGHAREATAIMETRIPEMGMDTARYEHFSNGFKPMPAAESLLSDAEEHAIFIINEAHHEPRHRVFTRSLLQGLYDRGYRHFGLETLVHRYRNVDSLLKAGHPLSLNDGFYTHDPQFAALVNEASEIGFSVFGYEQSGTGSPKLRELGQMRNIMRYRAAHPAGKLLLHVGYSHAHEGELGGRWEKAMAQRLADTTGLDPLTVNQTTFREMATVGKERFEYKDFPVSEPSLFIDSEGEAFNFNNEVKWFDRYVFHPRTVYRDGRPDYVFASGQCSVLVDLNSLPGEGPYLLQAYLTSDDMQKAVPRDVVERSNSEAISLALAPGDYQLLVQLVEGQQYVGTFVVK